MIRLPSLIPAPSQDFTLDKAGNSVRTAMESGRIRQRRTQAFSRFSAAIRWEMTSDEFQLFEQFLEYEAAAGTAWFEAPLFTGDTISNHKIRLVNGVYQTSYQSWGGWVVTAEADLEKLDLKGEVFYLLATSLPDHAKYLVDILEEAVNVTLPKAERILK